MLRRPHQRQTGRAASHRYRHVERQRAPRCWMRVSQTRLAPPLAVLSHKVRGRATSLVSALVHSGRVLLLHQRSQQARRHLHHRLRVAPGISRTVMNSSSVGAPSRKPIVRDHVINCGFQTALAKAAPRVMRVALQMVTAARLGNVLMANVCWTTPHHLLLRLLQLLSQRALQLPPLLPRIGTVRT
jgi:hypothetical protein